VNGLSTWSIVVTCEHGGNRVPKEHRGLFRGREALLSSHRGWDAGTLALARALAVRLGAPLQSATVTRLLVDLNRSPHNPRVFSSLTRGLPRGRRAELLLRYHAPHWDAVRALVAEGVEERGRVIHLGVHSFTPRWRGVARKPDIALLYDPARPGEQALAARWLRALERLEPGRVLRRNDPYRGNADGLTTALRKEHTDARYLGIEVEVSQRHVGTSGRFPEWVARSLVTSLRAALEPGA
jgi:predicted N-formylglutamate amidohydrolase